MHRRRLNDMNQTMKTFVLGSIAAAVMALAIVVPVTPALACSCAITTTEDVAASASFAFIGTEVGRVDTRARDFDPVLVTFAVDEWLSHADGPPEFQAFTGHGSGDCGIGPLQGQVAVFAYGSAEEASVGSCGSIQPIHEAVAAFEGKVVPDYPVAFDPVPESPGVSGSYADILLPAAAVAAVAALAALVVGRLRRQSTDQTP